MKFQPGDQVMISPDLSQFDSSEWPGLNLQMLEMAGEIHNISSTKEFDSKPGEGYFLLEDVPYIWDEKWLLPVYPEHDDAIAELDLNSIL